MSESEPSDANDTAACEDTSPYSPSLFGGPDMEGEEFPEIPDSQIGIAISDSDDEDLGISGGSHTPPVDDRVVAPSSSAHLGDPSLAQKILAVQKKLSQAKKELTAKNPENIQHCLNNCFGHVSEWFSEKKWFANLGSHQYSKWCFPVSQPFT